MAYQLFNLPPQQPLSAAGRILPGSKASFFLTTTDTPTPVYTTSALDVTHTQPVEADGGGRFPTIYLDPAITYKVTVTDANDVLLYTIDPVNDDVLDPDEIAELLYPQTSVEQSAGVTPVDFSRQPGDIRRYGAVSGQNCTEAIQNSLLATRVAEIPEQFTALIDETIELGSAGTLIRGKSRFTSIIQPTNDFTDSALLANTNQASGTGYGNSICDLFFKTTSPNGTDLNVICVDLASLNNCTVRRCRFAGTETAFADQLGTGVRFAAPLSAGAYSNHVVDCNFTLLEIGVLYAGGSNHNTVTGGEFITCKWGIHADPSSAVDTVKVIGPRFEDCDVSILEGTNQASYIACRFEASHTADFEFVSGSNDCSIFGGMTADSAATLLNSNLASGLHVFADDLTGVFVSHASSSRATVLIGPNVLAPNGETVTSANPSGITSVAAYFFNGRPVMDNGLDLVARNAAGTGALLLIRGDTNNRVRIGAGGEEVQFHNALIALGGGAAPTLGTIGGSGPATATQNSWKRFYDSSGQAFYIPVWK